MHSDNALDRERMRRTVLATADGGGGARADGLGARDGGPGGAPRRAQSARDHAATSESLRVLGPNTARVESPRQGVAYQR